MHGKEYATKIALQKVLHMYRLYVVTSSQAPSYASLKLRPSDLLTYLLTGVRCRATSVAKKNTLNLKTLSQHYCLLFMIFMKALLSHSFAFLATLVALHLTPVSK